MPVEPSCSYGRGRIRASLRGAPRRSDDMIRHLFAVICLFLAACGSHAATPGGTVAERRESSANAERDGGSNDGASPDDAQGEGLAKTERGWRLRTPAYAVNPGQERYVCYVMPV